MCFPAGSCHFLTSHSQASSPSNTASADLLWSVSLAVVRDCRALSFHALLASLCSSACNVFDLVHCSRLQFEVMSCSTSPYVQPHAGAPVSTLHGCTTECSCTSTMQHACQNALERKRDICVGGAWQGLGRRPATGKNGGTLD